MAITGALAKMAPFRTPQCFLQKGIRAIHKGNPCHPRVSLTFPLSPSKQATSPPQKPPRMHFPQLFCLQNEIPTPCQPACPAVTRTDYSPPKPTNTRRHQNHPWPAEIASPRPGRLGTETVAHRSGVGFPVTYSPSGSYEKLACAQKGTHPLHPPVVFLQNK